MTSKLHRIRKQIISILLFTVLGLQSKDSIANDITLKTLTLNNHIPNQHSLNIALSGAPRMIRHYAMEAPERIVIDLFHVDHQLSQSEYHYPSILIRSVQVVTTPERTRLIIRVNQTHQIDLAIEPQTIILSASHPPIIDSSRDSNSSLWHKQSGHTAQTINPSSSAISTPPVNPPYATDNSPSATDHPLSVAEPINSDISIKRTEQAQSGQQEASEDKDKDSPQETEHGISALNEKLSLNFQDLDIRSALRMIAEGTGLNIVLAPSVTGKVTLHLEQVAWTQALDALLSTHHLGRQQQGNVLLIAPRKEFDLQAREQLKHEISQRNLISLTTRYIRINYASAPDIARFLQGETGQNNRFLSERGRISADPRTNMLIIQDTPEHISIIDQTISELDIPLPQVLIEARVVTTRTNISNELGIRWAGGSDALIESASKTISNGDLSVDLSGRSGSYLSYSPIRGHFNIGYASRDILVDLELAALASEGKSKIIAQPRITTSDQHEASIRSGKQIPYREESSSGGTKIAFKDAVLSLEAQPKIASDQDIVLDLKITHDSLGSQEFDGAPAIDTNAIETRILVQNGRTIVLGGIYTSASFDQNFSVPVLGELPLLGNLFRHSEMSQEKVELLVFITPRLIRNRFVSLN